MECGRPTLRWCLEIEGRVGMVRDIVSVLAEAGANVEAMEVVARVVYIRFRLATRMHRTFVGGCVEDIWSDLTQALSAAEGTVGRDR